MTPTAHSSAFLLSQVRQVREGVPVLDIAELVIDSGSVTSLVGPSGAGKSSLLRLLNRLDDPVGGEIRYRAKLLNEYPVQQLRRRVGFVFQSPVMFPGTVRDNLSLAYKIGTSNVSPDEAKIVETLNMAGLDPALSDRDGEKLSVGQKQRVNIARALMTEPDVLLMDEPTSALDPETAERLMETVGRLSQETQLTVVMVTHRLAEARRVSDVTVVMEQGRIIAAGLTPDLFERSTDDRVRTFLNSEKSNAFPVSTSF
jgi:ABC-type methionine transport system ATPase subunit